MKNTVHLFLICVVANSCQNNEAGKSVNKPTAEKSYIELVNEQLALNSSDNASFLGFVLGSSRKEVQNQFSKLLNEKKIKPESTWNLPFAKIEGYPYQLQLNDSSSCDCALTDTYFEDKLYTLTLFVFGDCKIKDLKSFLTKVYGEPNYKEVKKEKYTESEKTYWLIGNKEILLSNVASFNAIEFTDLRLKMKDSKFRATIDTLNTALGKEKAKEAESDFK